MERRERPEDMDAVQVCVRIRPLSSKEKQEQTKSCIRIASSVDGLALPGASSAQSNAASGPQQIVVGKDRAFTFDNVLGVTSSQQARLRLCWGNSLFDTYQQCVAPLVNGFVEGYNATILAYGQTGTGKTHTMSGAGFDAKGDKNEDVQGIIPRTIKAIFRYMEANQQRIEFSLRVEFIEIYNEELRDLLHPDTPAKQLNIREDGEGNIVVSGVKSEVAQTREAVFRYLVIGGASRATGSTLMNEQSSRSHAIFSLLLHQRDLATGQCRKAKFHLVDLAGSERAKRTGAVAGRFKESVSINQGLLALGNVISALSDEKRRQGATATATTTTGNGGVHVPYRDSKLTRLLQDSLGGNSKTLMIACVSPATINFEETLNTLKYANRAKNIRNRPIVNQQEESDARRSDDEIARMKEQIASLQTKLQQTNAVATSRPVTTASSTRSGTRPSSSASSASSSATVSSPSAALIESTARVAALEQQLSATTAKIELAVETVESMRSLSLEAITTLIAMERELKPLGRPVQQQLNEAVKRLNAAIQAAQSCDLRTSGSSKDASNNRPETDTDESSERTASSSPSPAGAAAAASSDERLKRLANELKEAKHDLARDEQIFEMKSAEIQRLQTLLLDAKSKNEKLIQKVQQLERGGQLWSNVDTADSSIASGVSSTSATASGAGADELATGSTRSLSPPIAESKLPQDDSSDESERAATARATSTTASSTSSLRSTKAPSSRGLFTKRGGTAAYDGEEDNVLIGNGDDDDRSSSAKKREALKSRSGIPTAAGSSSAGAKSTTGDSSRISSSGGTVRGGRAELMSSSGKSEVLAKLERTIASLRSKVEELQQQNGELQHSREESSRRWQLDRQNYEHQINEAEQTIESLRKEKQALEDTLIEEKGNVSLASAAGAKSSVRRSQRAMPLVFELDEPESHETDTGSDNSTTKHREQSPADAKCHSVRCSAALRPATSKALSPVKLAKPLTVVLDECITQLIEYNDARRQVLGILKEKKDAEQSKDEAAKRISALEMQKLRQSLSVRESISDVSKSIRILNDKMQAESRSLDELERLRKLKDRAERKLRGLRKQEEQNEFLDSDTQQELADLVELIEDLNSHIAFQDAELAVAREDLHLIKTRSRADDASPFDSLASALVQRLVQSSRSNDEESVTEFVKRVLEEIARLRGREQELLGKASELQSVIDERSVTLQQLETGLVAARKEFDRRLVLERQESAMLANQLQQQLAQLMGQLQAVSTSSAATTTPQRVELDPAGRDDEWKKLIVGCQKKDEYIADLEKHLVFYKSKAKQMQAQLQQLIRESAKCNQQDDDDDDEEDGDDDRDENDSGDGDGRRDRASDRRSQREDAKRLQQRIQQLEDANDALMKDLATAKVYLRSASKARASGEGAQVVRISKSELRELPSGPSHAPPSREGKRNG